MSGRTRVPSNGDKPSDGDVQAESKRPLDDVVKEARAILRGTIAEAHDD